MKSHASFSLHGSSNHLFCWAILLQILLGEVSSDVIWIANTHRPSIAIFFFVVTAQVPDLVHILILCFSLPFFELCKDFKFLPHEADLDFSWMIIHKSDKIANTATWSCQYWPLHIGINVVKNLLCSIFIFIYLRDWMITCIAFYVCTTCINLACMTSNSSIIFTCVAPLIFHSYGQDDGAKNEQSPPLRSLMWK